MLRLAQTQFAVTQSPLRLNLLRDIDGYACQTNGLASIIAKHCATSAQNPPLAVGADYPIGLLIDRIIFHCLGNACSDPLDIVRMQKFEKPLPAFNILLGGKPVHFLQAVRP